MATKTVHKPEFKKNIEKLGYLDLNDKPGFQMAMQKVKGNYYLYMASIKHPGWAVIDVTDPKKMRYIRWIDDPGGKAGTSCLKIQVADGIMITSISGSLAWLTGTNPSDPYDAGIYIWDVKTDPEYPKVLSFFATGGRGVHRSFYNGGKYAHLSAGAPGFHGYIYRIIDVSNPEKPVEAGRWWLPEQWEAGITGKLGAGLPGSIERLNVPGLHGPPYIKGHYAYCGWGAGGIVILDISDIAVPKLVGRLKLMPPLSGGFAGARCHTVLPMSGRDIAIVTNEGERFPAFNKEKLQGVPQPLNIIGVVDIADVTNPTLIATFPYPEVPPGYPYKNFNEVPGVGAPPFGPHNLHEPHGMACLEDRQDRVYNCYFHAGLRVYDISDRFVPKEIAYFLPEDPTKWAYKNYDGKELFPGPLWSVTEDVIVDDRHNIFMNTMQQGLYSLRCTI